MLCSCSWLSGLQQRHEFTPQLSLLACCECSARGLHAAMQSELIGDGEMLMIGDRQMLIIMAALATTPGEDHICVMLEHSACTVLCANRLLEEPDKVWQHPIFF